MSIAFEAKIKSANTLQMHIFYKRKRILAEKVSFFIGILLLWIAGIQVSWEILESVTERNIAEETYVNEIHMVFNITREGIIATRISTAGFGYLFVLMFWYIAIVIGSAAGALLNNVLPVKIIYVSKMYFLKS